MTRTLELGYPDWDLHVNDGGMLPILEGSEALTQNVSNKCRAFTEDMYLSYDEGMPHFDIELGNTPPEALVKSRYRRQAMSVEGVTDAELETYAIVDRTLTGTIIITDENGNTSNVRL